MEKGLMSLCKYAQDEGFLPPRYTRYVTEKPLSLRGFVHARENWCIVESDYKTAELRALAFVSGDEKMMSVICDPDPTWAFCRRPGEKDKKVRIGYAEDSGIAPEHQHPAFLRAIVSSPKRVESLVEGLETPAGMSRNAFAWSVAEARANDPKKPVVVVDRDKHMIVVCEKVSPLSLVRDKDGNLIHPGHDMHWELIEFVRKKPREMLKEKTDRGAGKTGNFSSAYGATAASLERKIYADTGEKPEEGTGQGILDALNLKFPVAQQFLRDQELKVFEGKDQAFSGRIRHFPLHSAAFGVSRRNRESVASAWGRESRNFPFQSSVASVATRAYIKLMRHYREHKMQSEVIALLYDSIVTHCPLEERMEVKRLHQLYMCDDTAEFYGPRKLTYPIDTEFNVGWSVRPDKKTEALYDDPLWRAPVCA